MHVASTMVYCFVYSLEVVLMCVCMVLFEAFWWRQEEQWTRSWSFFWREREFSASPVVIATPTQEFSRQKNPMSNFFPHPTLYVDYIRASMSSEYYHFAGLCDLKMLWAAIVVCSCHFDEKSHDANNSRNVEVEVTYFVHIFSPPPTLSFFHM